MAEAHYAQIAPHLYCGPIEGAANIQIDTCSPNFLIQDGIHTWGGFHAEILKDPICWEERRYLWIYNRILKDFAEQSITRKPTGFPCVRPWWATVL
jgi:L-alanine-DL-glutamate epimerase-like enolase superfamily enzyme